MPDGPQAPRPGLVHVRTTWPPASRATRKVPPPWVPEAESTSILNVVAVPDTTRLFALLSDGSIAVSCAAPAPA